MAELVMAATKYGWQCTRCKQLFDAMWRPIKQDKIWQPPLAFNWMIDKPQFNFCPICGAEFKEVDKPTDELRLD